MKKRITLIASMLMLTGSIFYFSGCKKTVENLFDVECFKCVHPTDPTGFPDQDNVCTAVGVDPTVALEASGYVCTKQ
jgi:hypothetical protein